MRSSIILILFGLIFFNFDLVRAKGIPYCSKKVVRGCVQPKKEGQTAKYYYAPKYKGQSAEPRMRVISGHNKKSAKAEKSKTKKLAKVSDKVKSKKFSKTAANKKFTKVSKPTKTAGRTKTTKIYKAKVIDTNQKRSPASAVEIKLKKTKKK